MKNNYFNIVRYVNQDDFEILTCIHIKKDVDIWDFILKKYLNNIEYAKKSYEDPYGSIHHLDIKDYLYIDFIDVYTFLEQILYSQNININDIDIKIFIGTSNDYRKFDKQFDNEMTFLEYINSEISETDKRRNITVEILKSAGFENITKAEEIEYYKKEFDIDNYSSWRIWTDSVDNKENCLKLDIDTGPTNNGSKWHLHIDNNVCNSIGSADIDTVWQFNQLMSIFNSKFKL